MGEFSQNGVVANLHDFSTRTTDQIEKDRATRLGQMVDFRQRVGTRGALIQQGQIGNQELARQGMTNIGSVLGQAPTLQ